MTANTKRGIQIITGIAKTAQPIGQQFTKEQLNNLLELFNHHPSNDDLDYKNPDKLVLWAYSSHYFVNDAETAKYIRVVFPWFKPKIDLSLLDM